MKTIKLGELFKKYEEECNSREECGGCPYDEHYTCNDRYGCMKYFLNINGVPEEVIEKASPIISGEEDAILCANCYMDCTVYAHTCIICALKKVIDFDMEIEVPSYIKVSDLKHEWDKLFNNTPYHNSLHYILERIEQNGNI